MLLKSECDALNRRVTFGLVALRLVGVGKVDDGALMPRALAISGYFLRLSTLAVQDRRAVHGDVVPILHTIFND